MRKAVFAIILVLLLVVACKGLSRESAIRQLEPVRIFDAINGDVTYTESRFSGQDAASIADLVTAECPQGVGDEFTRVTLDAKAMTMVLYVSGKENITCSILKPKEATNITIRPQTDAPDEGTLLLVNDKPITVTQLQQALAALPQNVPRDLNTTSAVLNQLVNEELLRQAAADTEVTDAEIAEAREQIMQNANLTESRLSELLTSQKRTSADFDQAVKEQAQLEKLLRERLLTDELNISEADAREYYLANTNQFVQSEQAVARFLIVGGNRSAQARTRVAQEVAGKINTTDFCALVQQYSDDENGKENCGVYVIPRGALNPDVEYAAFSTPVNQTSVVQTEQGIFFVQTLRVNPAQVMPYTEVANSVQSGLRNTLLQQRLNLFLISLRADAEIVSYLG